MSDKIAETRLKAIVAVQTSYGELTFCPSCKGHGVADNDRNLKHPPTCVTCSGRGHIPAQTELF